MATCLSRVVHVTPTAGHSVPSDAPDVKHQMGAWGRREPGEVHVSSLQGPADFGTQNRLRPRSA